jgi:hypothetical protein
VPSATRMLHTASTRILTASSTYETLHPFCHVQKCRAGPASLPPGAMASGLGKLGKELEDCSMSLHIICSTSTLSLDTALTLR